MGNCVSCRRERFPTTKHNNTPEPSSAPEHASSPQRTHSPARASSQELPPSERSSSPDTVAYEDFPLPPRPRAPSPRTIRPDEFESPSPTESERASTSSPGQDISTAPQQTMYGHPAGNVPFVGKAPEPQDQDQYQDPTIGDRGQKLHSKMSWDSEISYSGARRSAGGPGEKEEDAGVGAHNTGTRTSSPELEEIEEDWRRSRQLMKDEAEVQYHGFR